MGVPDDMHVDPSIIGEAVDEAGFGMAWMEVEAVGVVTGAGRDLVLSVTGRSLQFFLRPSTDDPSAHAAAVKAAGSGRPARVRGRVASDGGRLILTVISSAIP